MKTLWTDKWGFWVSDVDFSVWPGTCGYAVSDELAGAIEEYQKLKVGQDNDTAGMIADRLEEEAETAGADERYHALIAYMRLVFAARGHWTQRFGLTWPWTLNRLTTGRTETD